MGRYQDIKDGKYKTQKELHDAERLRHKETLKTWNRQVPKLPPNLIGHDEGKYATSHRCFGKQCPVDPPKSDRYAMRPSFEIQALSEVD